MPACRRGCASGKDHACGFEDGQTERLMLAYPATKIFMNWAETFRCCILALVRIPAGLCLCFLSSPLVAQFVPGGGGVPERPADSSSSSTNFLDLNGDSRFDFAVIQNNHTTYTPGFGGWSPRTTTSISLVPLEMSEVLVADVSSPISGDLPSLSRGDVIGPVAAGVHWTGDARSLVTREEPGGLSGLLGPVLIGLPGRIYLGVRLVQLPSPPVYGWLCFTREGGVAFPISWGCSETPDVPVLAGDPRSIPSPRLAITLSGPTVSPLLTWKPPIGDVKIEEVFSVSPNEWRELPVSIYPGYALQGVRVGPGSSASAGVPRIFRVRISP